MPSFICCLHAAYAGNIQKAQPSAFRNSIKFLSLCSRLFLCNPIVMHWSWNQSPVVHAASVWFQTVGAQREDSHNSSVDSRINKRENIWKISGPDPAEGTVCKVGPAGQVRMWAERRTAGHGGLSGTRAWRLEKIESNWTQHCSIHSISAQRTAPKCSARACVRVRSELWRAPARWGSQACTIPYISVL